MGGQLQSAAPWLGALAALLIGTTVFHVRGSGYVTLRVFYIVFIVGVLIASFVFRRHGGSGRAVVVAVDGGGTGAAHLGRRLRHRPGTPRTPIPSRTASGPYSVR